MREIWIGVTLTATMALAGCVAEPSYTEFDREPTAADHLQSEVVNSAGLQADTVRYLAEWEDSTVFLAKSSLEQLEGRPCVVYFTTVQSWASTCMSKPPEANLVTGDGTNIRLTFSAPEESGWTRLGEGVYVR